MLANISTVSKNRASNVVDVASDMLAMAPARPAGSLAGFLDSRRDHFWIVLTVAVAIVLAAGGLIAWAYIVCIRHGGSFTGHIGADWHRFSIDVSLECVQ